LEINKTVIVASSWSSIFILPTLMMHGQTQIKFIFYLRMRWAGHVARMGERRGIYRVWWGNLREREHMGGKY
jgi:hypothetical protein